MTTMTEEATRRVALRLREILSSLDFSLAFSPRFRLWHFATTTNKIIRAMNGYLMISNAAN